MSELEVVDPSKHETNVHSLKEEIDALNKQQTAALINACYLGMTPDEAKKYDARRERIMKLGENLRQLEKAL